MQRHTKTTLILAAVAAVVLTIPVARAADPAAPVPLGHPDFYPSHERPIGWRGDQTGAWPGANCVSYWDVETTNNIVWAAKTPGAGYCQPIVVGEKVFITADPNLLVCYNVHTGEQLWQTAIDHTSVMEPDLQKAARAERDYLDHYWLEYSAFCDQFEKLHNMVVDAGLKPDAIYSQGKNAALFDPAKQAEKTAEVMKNPEIAALWTQLYATQQRLQMTLVTGPRGYNYLFSTDLGRRVQAAQRKYSLWFGGGWTGWSTWSFPTPCSDGERVYLTTVNNAVAAVNLDGTIAWLVWDHLGNQNGERRTDQGIGVRYHASPQLYGDKLIVHQDSHMRVYDKHTGKKIWEYAGMYGARRNAFPQRQYPEMKECDSRLPKAAAGTDWTAVLTAWLKSSDFFHGLTQTPEGSSPVVLEVPLPDGTIMPVVHDGDCFIYRLDDGKVLTADMPGGGRSTTVAFRNLLMASCANTYMMRLTAKDRDTIMIEYVYKNLTDDPAHKQKFVGASSETTIFHNGWWFTSCGKRLSGEDGRLESLPALAGGLSSPILVGDRFFRFLDGPLFSNTVSKLRTLDGSIKARSVCLSSGRIVDINNAAVDRRLSETSEFSRRTKWMDSLNWVSLASPSAQANRLFFRTLGMLYCYGDPGVAFPTPKGCPSAARVPAVALETEASALVQNDDVAKLTAALAHAHPRMRREAARRLGELKTPASAVEPLRRLAVEDASAAVRVAALRSLGLTAEAPGAAALREFVVVIGNEVGKNNHPSPILGEVLRQLGREAEPVLLAILREGQPKAREAVAMSIVYRDVSRSDALRDALIPLVVEKKIREELGASVLAQWPNDPVVMALFNKLLNDGQFRNIQPTVFAYLLPVQDKEQVASFLANVAEKTPNDRVRGEAVTALVDRKAFEVLGQRLASAKGQAQGALLYPLFQAAKTPEAKTFAVAQVKQKLEAGANPTELGLATLPSLGADAAPLLPLLKAIKTEDANFQKQVADIVAQIERQVKEAAEKK